MECAGIVSVRRGEINLPQLGNAATLALDESRPEQWTRTAHVTGPGVSSVGQLANLTSHS